MLVISRQEQLPPHPLIVNAIIHATPLPPFVRSIVRVHACRFCPYFTPHGIAASTSRASGGSETPLPLSPVTPMRPRRSGKSRSLPPTPGNGDGDNEEKGDAEGGRRDDGSRKDSGGGVGGSGRSKGMLSFVCFSMGGEAFFSGCALGGKGCFVFYFSIVGLCVLCLLGGRVVLSCFVSSEGFKKKTWREEEDCLVCFCISHVGVFVCRRCM